jgi:maleamate amidohydrolase
MLVAQRIDSLIVTGCTTSGCVRATVVDAMQLGYRTVVAEDCCADRDEAPHRANLFDMRTKYADVVMSAEVIRDLEALNR